jgi:hypothetical protein
VTGPGLVFCPQFLGAVQGDGTFSVRGRKLIHVSPRGSRMSSSNGGLGFEGNEGAHSSTIQKSLKIVFSVSEMHFSAVDDFLSDFLESCQ